MFTRLTDSQIQRISNAICIAAFNARSPAEVELDLIDRKDGRWSAEDRARRAELVRVIAAGEG